MKIVLVLLCLAVSCFLGGPRAALAQDVDPSAGSGQGAPETSPVGVISESEGDSEPAPSRVTLKLAGAACEVNEVESTLLRLNGVVGVDVETKKDHLIVDYDPNKLTAQQVTDTLMRKKGCFAPIVPGGMGP